MSDPPEQSLMFGGPPQEEEMFAVQVLRYLDGLATPQDLSELKESLACRPGCRVRFVQLCRLHGELMELLAPERAALKAATAAAGAAGSVPSQPQEGSRTEPSAPAASDFPLTVAGPEESLGRPNAAERTTEDDTVFLTWDSDPDTAQ